MRFNRAVLHYPHLVFSTNLITYSFLWVCVVGIKGQKEYSRKKDKSKVIWLFISGQIRGYEGLNCDSVIMSVGRSVTHDWEPLARSVCSLAHNRKSTALHTPTEYVTAIPLLAGIEIEGKK